MPTMQEIDRIEQYGHFSSGATFEGVSLKMLCAAARRGVEADAVIQSAQPAPVSDDRIEQIYDETAGAMGDDYAHAGWLAFARALLSEAGTREGWVSVPRELVDAVSGRVIDGELLRKAFKIMRAAAQEGK